MAMSEKRVRTTSYIGINFKQHVNDKTWKQGNQRCDYDDDDDDDTYIHIHLVRILHYRINRSFVGKLPTQA